MGKRGFHLSQWPFLFHISGADETVSVTLVYPGNRVFAFVCSLGCTLAQTAIIQGTKGIIQVNSLYVYFIYSLYIILVPVIVNPHVPFV